MLTLINSTDVNPGHMVDFVLRFPHSKDILFSSFYIVLFVRNSLCIALTYVVFMLSLVRGVIWNYSPWQIYLEVPIQSIVNSQCLVIMNLNVKICVWVIS